MTIKILGGMCKPAQHYSYDQLWSIAQQLRSQELSYTALSRQLRRALVSNRWKRDLARRDNIRRTWGVWSRV